MIRWVGSDVPAAGRLAARGVGLGAGRFVPLGTALGFGTPRWEDILTKRRVYVQTGGRAESETVGARKMALSWQT